MKLAFTTAGHAVEDHIADVGKKIGLGSGSQRSVVDIAVSSYACYFIAR